MRRRLRVCLHLGLLAGLGVQGLLGRRIQARRRGRVLAVRHRDGWLLRGVPVDGSSHRALGVQTDVGLGHEAAIVNVALARLLFDNHPRLGRLRALAQPKLLALGDIDVKICLGAEVAQGDGSDAWRRVGALNHRTRTREPVGLRLLVDRGHCDFLRFGELRLIRVDADKGLRHEAAIVNVALARLLLGNHPRLGRLCLAQP